jgi:hypothetical protein
MTPEGRILQSIRLELGTVPRLVLWRNNTGALVDQNGRLVRFGLAVGSADLVGCLDGRFVALEVKTPTGRVSQEQAQWIECVRRNGGLATVVRSVGDAAAFIDAARCRHD